MLKLVEWFDRPIKQVFSKRVIVAVTVLMLSSLVVRAGIAAHKVNEINTCRDKVAEALRTGDPVQEAIDRYCLKADPTAEN